jgi:hypothetical protein
MFITHEQWVLTSSLSLDNLELNLVQFSWILELWIIIYDRKTNYPRLIIKLELIIKQNYFIILFQRSTLNSNYRTEIILLLNLVKLLQISKVHTRFEFELIWINRMENNKQHRAIRFDPQFTRPTHWKWSIPSEPFGLVDQNRGSILFPTGTRLTGRFRPVDDLRSGEVVPSS